MPKKVLLATRPLTPPWDEASKNFAYFLGKTVQGHVLTLLSSVATLPGLMPQAKVRQIFSRAHFDWRAKFELLSYLRQARSEYDITHYLFTPTKFNTRALKLLAYPRKGKTIQTIATLRQDLYSPAELQSLLFADHITVYTQATLSKLQSLGFQNVSCIYPGIDLDLYKPQAKDPAVLKTYGLSETDFLAIYPGEYTRLGVTDILFDAWVDFFQKNQTSNIKFLFACRIKNEADRVKKESLEQETKKLGLEGNILFQNTHATVNMAALYNTADVVLFPVENLRGKFDVPLVIIEAYACAKPVILSDLSAFQEFSNPDICVTVPRGSGQAITDSVAYLSQNVEEREKISAAARTFAQAHFDLKKTAEAYEKLYALL
ncbi:MAG: glycosyltransferase [Candidatus Moraniibacteriota bacterium]|nr:MAG: glycosyltransferase [Candidatus Moranbacteria bacterium]